MFPQRETGVGGKNGAGERSEGGIDRYQTDEGGSEGFVRREIRLRAKGGVERNRYMYRTRFLLHSLALLKRKKVAKVDN